MDKNTAKKKRQNMNYILNLNYILTAKEEKKLIERTMRDKRQSSFQPTRER